ncbi:FAD-dependent oxidoreductase [Cellulomonas aerilata]|uniref:FAD-dependent oxidoreductase n=1 Tax=Cellulomonas aerilata TaxID=515326 RepID=UPI001FE8641A|nr:FAD-dependent oxidoreductase [Cellulomonas aerilata]
MPDDLRLATEVRALTGTSTVAAPAPIPPPAHPLRSVVVVGAGLAGTQTVAALRAQGFDGRVTLVGREALDPYDRPPLSKHLFDHPEPTWLADELGADVHALADDVLRPVTAQRLTVEAAGAVVATSSGEVRADAVVLATGSHAVRPAGWGAAVTLHTADDAARLRDRLRRGRRLVVVGAGWIGAEVAGVAAAEGVHVTVVEAATTPLGVALGARVGDLTTGWYAAAGVELVTGGQVVAVAQDGVRLADGRHLAADVVLAAVGARPETAWLDGVLPRDPDGSLRVDTGHGVVGAPGHLRAVGDIARRWSPRHGWVGGGHWDGALRGPAVAVTALLGGGPPADPAPYVFSTQLGHDLTLYGQAGAGDELVLRGDPDAGDGWGALWFSAPDPGDAAVAASGGGADGRALTAVLAVDRPRDVAAARRLFTGPHLPRLHPEVAADGARSLRDAVVA